MFAPLDRDSPPAVARFAPILLGNLIPLAGVLWYGWNATTLVAVYALELLLTFPLAAAKALIAQRPPGTEEDDAGILDLSDTNLTGKRGSATVVDWLPPVYPRNIPFSAVLLGNGLGVAAFVGLLISDATSVVDAVERPAVAVGGASLLAGQVVETWRDYVRGGAYESASPYSVVEMPARRAFFLLSVLLAIAGFVDDDGGVTATVVLVGFVAAKLVVEWSAFRATHGGGGRLSNWLSGPEASVEGVSAPDVPTGDPDARVATDRRSALATAVATTLVGPAPRYLHGGLWLWFLSLVVVGDGEVSAATMLGVGAVVALLLAAAVAVKALGFYLRYGHVEYRRYGDRLVAYDTWLDEPQWSSPLDSLRGCKVVGDRLPDRLFDTRTVATTTGWDEAECQRFLGPLADPETATDALGLSVGTVQLEPPRRPYAAVAVLSAVALVAAFLAMTVGPWATDGSFVLAVFVLPFGHVVPQALWHRVYPDGTD